VLPSAENTLPPQPTAANAVRTNNRQLFGTGVLIDMELPAFARGVLAPDRGELWSVGNALGVPSELSQFLGDNR
jgi:hypothetical protein